MADLNEKMQDTLIIAGSYRSNSESLRISQWINREFYQGQARLIDLHSLSLPLWDGGALSDSDTAAAIEQWQQSVQQARQLIIVSPEWHGSAPAALKNALQWSLSGSLAHKPCLLVGISAAVGGAFAISDIRASCYKNSRLLFLPEHIILRNVTDLWLVDNAANQAPTEQEQYLRQRLQYATDQLSTYGTALSTVRSELVQGLEQYPNGMS